MEASISSISDGGRFGVCILVMFKMGAGQEESYYYIYSYTILFLSDLPGRNANSLPNVCLHFTVCCVEFCHLLEELLPFLQTARQMRSPQKWLLHLC